MSSGKIKSEQLEEMNEFTLSCISLKMTKDTSKILRCSYCKIFKVCCMLFRNRLLLNTKACKLGLFNSFHYTMTMMETSGERVFSEFFFFFFFLLARKLEKQIINPFWCNIPLKLQKTFGFLTFSECIE